MFDVRRLFPGKAEKHKIPLSKDSLRAIAHETIKMSRSIVKKHAAQGASTKSTFHAQQLPPLDQPACPNHVPSEVQIIHGEPFALARISIDDDPAAKVAVLNLANFEQPAGPWLELLTTTQEESLCYTSTLYKTLKPEYYPWPNLGPGSVVGIYSPGVVVFRASLDKGCGILGAEHRSVLSVLTVSAPAQAPLTPDGEAFEDPATLEHFREKIRLVYRMAAHNGQEYLILGAMGCGTYKCPPRLVAKEMRVILCEQEFRGWFKKVAFAIYSRSSSSNNYSIFQEAFQGVQV
ncbi:hypothetical protein FB45DRAFT_1062096 [Roridomyces roridus]|uniref:Microbial-type PARG catalytic domain-containing protein n=1 Tax=Roridomyces roridus TaxID=1738132 RepID=A0AAD7BH51_9AGAR|nr:hypothetical protein FB45DRAFT_1062096 [Roridomyces roridus]